ncbi:MAG: GGDEF domain-containing protein [Thermodesulfobacteriota bacterium]|nr:GGDEF domain-containing protein [Thermodesulfobacteriota bacterium]
MTNEIEGLNKGFRLFLFISVLVLPISIATIRYLTGSEYALSLFYLLPICTGTWFIGKRAGIFLSFFSATTWLLADLMLLHEYSRSFIPFVNETFRLIVFLILTMVLSRLKVLLENEKGLARKDFLTGIANRRRFFELTDIEIQRANRYNTPLTVIYLDLDNFKGVNDKFGHKTGDTLLCEVAKTISKNIRSIDTVARLGGDEFVVLLPETKAKPAEFVSRKIHNELLKVMKSNGWPVTLSIGVATYNKIRGTVDEIMKEADTLMYSVKLNGKNMIKHQILEN